MPSDAATASDGGIAAEKTKEVPLIRLIMSSVSTEHDNLGKREAYLMVDDNGGTRAESATSCKTICERTHEDIDLSSLKFDS